MKTAFRAALACSISLFFCHTTTGQTAADYHNRADAALQSFLLKFFNGGAQYLKHNYPDNGQLTGYWTYANGWDAVLDAVERTGAQQYGGLIETLYLGQNERGWLVAHYDDEAWMCLALIRAYDLTGRAEYLAKAEELFADIQGGWDTTCCGPNPGGIWWDKAHTQKATAANAGPALAGARLYARTGDSSYLSFATTVYSYWLANMVHPATWQVADHIDPNGAIVWWRFTYNEGLMIGASVELYEATGDPGYLANAHNFAGFMINNEITSTAYGNVLYDGSNSGCGGDCHQFKGPAYRYLHRLYQLDTSQTQYYNVLKASADALWNLARNSSLNIFSVDWAGPSMSSASQPADNAACMALSRFAQTAGAYPGSGIPAGRYEAENAVLHHIGLEGNGSGFTGWGYLAGWNGDGQWVDFNISNATAGTRTLTFRYAAGAGDAYRQIYINGQTVVPAKLFLGTGSWSSYNTVTVSHNFPAGPSAVSVIFAGSLGSANWLNLDNLEVSQNATVAFTSVGAQDGYALESSETSNLGGSSSATSSSTSALRAVDDSSDRQYKAFVSFDTSSLPDNAAILSATLKLRRGTVSGANPFTTHSTCLVDIKGGAGFGGSLTPANSDFQAAADANQVATLSNAPNNGDWSTGTLNSAGRASINKTGHTQFKIYFLVDDNDDLGTDYIGWYSGDNSTAGNRPVLEVVYQ